MKRVSALAFLALLLASPLHAQTAPEQQSVTAVKQVAGFRLTKTELKAKLEEALKEKGIAESVSATIIGTIPAVVYEAPTSFSSKVTVAQTDEKAQTFQAELQLISDETAQLVRPPFMVNGRYEAMHRIPVLTHRLNDKETITPADIAWMEVPARRMDRTTVTTEKDLIGKSPRRTLSANRPIRGEELMEAQIVQKNDQVNVVYRVGRLEVKVTGMAMQSGAAGDMISVRNSDSRALISAKVIGPGQLEVPANGMQLSLKQ